MRDYDELIYKLIFNSNYELTKEERILLNEASIKVGAYDKYKQLEEQIGCPLEIRYNIFYNSTIYNCLGYKMTVKETYDDHFIAVIENDIFSFDYKDYKKTWWLKEDRSK